MEQTEIAHFLSLHAPFSALNAEAMAPLVRSVVIRYFRKADLIIDAGVANDWLSIVRSGAVELRLGGTELNARLGEGGCFGYPSLLRGMPTQNQVVAREDCLIYRIPKAIFLAAHQAHPALRDFFMAEESDRLRRAVAALRESQQQPDAGTLTAHAPIGSLIRRKRLVSAPSDMSIAMAAQLMTKERVSTLPVMENGKLVGIITDKDLRTRVLALARSLNEPLVNIMTPDPLTAVEDTPLLSALLTMTERHIHHLPVTDAAGRIIAMISSSDLLARLGSNALHLAARINNAEKPSEVADATQQLPQAMIGLVDAGVDADNIARFVSAIGESAHRRILKLVEAQLGPPPVAYALICFGSLARAEQALGADQDNGFLFDEAYDARQHGEYFAEMGRRLADGLNGAGYVYCPGNIMASNAAYRQSVRVWMERFEGWIDTPDPQSILESGIFFDMRGLAGDRALVDQMRATLFAKAADNRIFQSFVARSAASARIPLGFFRNFLLADDAEEGKVLDLKKQAIAPLVDLSRAYALAHNITATNSTERLRAARDCGAISAAAASDLIDSFEFVRDVRFRHQAEQINAGIAVSNKLAPENLSRFDREHLRDAFILIRENLDYLRSNLAGGIN